MITGGAGFLGSHLCERLMLHGYEVFCVANLLTGTAANLLPLRETGRSRSIPRIHASAGWCRSVRTSTRIPADQCRALTGRTAADEQTPSKQPWGACWATSYRALH